MQKRYRVTEEFVNNRLDKFISCVDSEYSRSFIQENITNGNILVNDNITKPSYKVALDDEVLFNILENKELEIKAENLNLDIVYEDEDIAVINKPKGMVVHPSVGHHTNTLVQGLMYELDNLSGINGVNRPGIVHRIDKDTSGLLIIAKNDNAHQKLVEQLKDHTLSRKYYAIVCGVITEDKGRINAPIGRDPKDRKKQAVVASGKEAITHFTVLERFKNHTLVECVLETGRTHQIRVHMQYIKKPILGDPLYGSRKVYGEIGQYLHAKKIGFIHPTSNKYLEFEVDLPKYFLDELKRLKEDAE